MKKTQIHTMIEILTVKPFMLMWVSQLLTQVAFNMLVFMSGLILYEQSKSVFSISLLHMSVSIPSAIFALVSGVVVDRLDKKSIMIFSVILRALLLCGILYTIKLTNSLYIREALVSMVSQLFVPAEAALIPRFVRKEHLLAANSLFIMTFYTAIIGGFVLGGLLLGMIGQLWMLILLLVFYIVSAVFLLFLPSIKDYETGRSQLQLSKLYADTINVLRYIKSTPLVFQAIMLLTLAQAIIQIFVTVGPGFADKILAIKITDASVFILGPATVGMIIGAIFIGSMGGIFRKRRLINTGIFLSGTLLVFMSLLTVFRQSDK